MKRGVIVAYPKTLCRKCSSLLTPEEIENGLCEKCQKAFRGPVDEMEEETTRG